MATPSTDQDRIINTAAAADARHAAIDAMARNKAALAADPFFSSKEHQDRIAAVTAIVEGFFQHRDGVYVNHRPNRGKPFSTVKIEKPQFPNVSQAAKKSRYLDPLRALGVEIVLSKQTNSYLYHVR